MNPQDLKQILEALSTAEVREFNLKTQGYELSIRRGADLAPMAIPSTGAVVTPTVVTPTVMEIPVVQTPVVQTPAQVDDSSKWVPVKAPIVGTFYRSSSPDAAPFIQEGDRVQVGQILCILEAMKLMNEIETEVAGIVRKVLIQNASPVEYGQDLFLIEPA